MSTQLEQFRIDGVGVRGAEVRYEVSADAIRSYAAATDDPSSAAGDGLVATPVFAIVPVWEAIAPASKAVATDEARKRVVHYSQDMVLHHPIEAGMELVSTATPVALLQRRSGSALVIHTESRTAAGELVNEQWVTEFFRGIDTPEERGKQPPDHRLPDAIGESEPFAEVAHAVSLDQPDRYAEASGDRFAIHLDDEAARAVGLPGRILHGFCTLAFMSTAVCEATHADPSSVARLAARFSAPVFPGGTVTARLWRLGDGAIGFEAVDGNGQVVLKDGRAEFHS